MKKLSWQLVLPLTVISFFFITKWWYVTVIDGWDIEMSGFPLPFNCPGFHTSMSLQIFVLELIFDLLFYYGVWFVLVYLFHRYVVRIKLHYMVTISLITLASMLAAMMIFVAILPENKFKFTRDFDFELIDSGLDYGQSRKRPEFKDYER
ncbi:MAG: hypothetical protein MK078_15345 [Crocinitomicaceae bacterium]|nr:hypothetical protein [Crocinitomicaceae bacterium]